ncbi:hypothetical protein [uncultured Sulfitobacter sp.]|uniref:hypothetical protein n=1 Tax=uncultured Sulfitobacter sp. TaxID=191468 RepID=UPI00261F4DB8|nr:hypothetical protein [uncultured Sulfitobacter sp.]
MFPFRRWQNATLLEVDLICPDAWFPADWLGVADYRALGVLTTLVPTGTLPRQTAVYRPATVAECHRFARRGPDAGLVPVASALFHHMD